MIALHRLGTQCQLLGVGVDVIKLYCILGLGLGEVGLVMFPVPRPVGVLALKRKLWMVGVLQRLVKVWIGGHLLTLRVCEVIPCEVIPDTAQLVDQYIA